MNKSPREDRQIADEVGMALDELLRKAPVSDDVDFLREGVRRGARLGRGADGAGSDAVYGRRLLSLHFNPQQVVS